MHHIIPFLSAAASARSQADRIVPAGAHSLADCRADFAQITAPNGTTSVRGLRFYNAVDLVNQQEKEKLLGKAGNLAKQLAQMDAVILDELGYLPFPTSGGALQFHLISRLYEKTSLIITTSILR